MGNSKIILNIKTHHNYSINSNVKFCSYGVKTFLNYIAIISLGVHILYFFFNIGSEGLNE